MAVQQVQRQFVLKIHRTGGGEAIHVMMFEYEARKMIVDHKAGTLPAVIGDTGVGLPWTVRSCDISALQMFPADGMAQANTPPYHRGSGLN